MQALASYRSEIMISNCSVLKERVSNAGGRFYVDYFDWSDIRIAMHYTHRVEDEKRKAAEQTQSKPPEPTWESSESISRDRSVTK